MNYGLIDFVVSLVVSAIVTGLLLWLTPIVWWLCVLIGLVVGFGGVLILNESDLVS